MNKLIVAIIRHERLEELGSALKKEKITFMYSEVKGFCKEIRLFHKDIQQRVRLEIVVKDAEADRVKDIILSHVCCGLKEDGCLSIYNLEEFISFSECNK
jgi:nitrogen regulatory protein PII